jgi:sarcosine oxidase
LQARKHNGRNVTDFPPSLWFDTAIDAPQVPPLGDDLSCDVVIVGAGFTGLTAALTLAEAGVSCAVLDAEAPGWGASGRNGGQVNPLLPVHSPDDVYRMIGQGAGERLVQAALASADDIFAMVKKYRIDCEARQNGWIRTAHFKGAAEKFEKQCESWRRAGADISVLETGDLHARLGSSAYQMGALMPAGGCVQPLSYARGLLKAALGSGVKVFGESRVVSLEKSGDDWIAKTAQGSVRASKVVLATNGYTDNLWSGLKESVVPVISIQMATEIVPEEIRGSMLKNGETFADSRRTIYYGRFDAAGRFLLGSLGQSDSFKDGPQYQRVAREAVALFPQLEGIKWTHRWGGRIAVTRDFMPHLHSPAEGVLAGLGYNGRGVAMSGVVGRAMAAHMLGAREDELALPVTEISGYPFHRFHGIGVRAAMHWYNLRDNMERVL